ncbi:MAG: hypothetical protein HDQ94_00685 [Desulfovibrio sp.]|nr:hypothetical protein [Desulfovibrio sp.]
MYEGSRLLVLGLAPEGRARSLGRFLGAGFLGFGLLLLLAGVQQSLPPALAGGGACIFSGLALLVALRRGRAPIALLDPERGDAVLCRLRLGGRAFRAFPLAALEITASSDGRAVLVRPARDGETGRELPGLPSRICDREWQQGMRLPTPAGEATGAAAELERWQRLALTGSPPALEDACDAAEFAALLGKALPRTLLPGFSRETVPAPSHGAAGESPGEAYERPTRTGASPRPEIRRAPDLRDAGGKRDKRE